MKLIEEIVKLFGFIAWPISVVAIVFFLRVELKSFLGGLSRRVNDPSSDLSIGKEGLSIKTRVEAALGKIESLEVDQTQAKELIFQVASVSSLNKGNHEKTDNHISQELLDLADKYMNIDIEDWTERVRAKDAISREMVNVAITNNISKDALMSQSQEGILMALVTYIHLVPEKNDFNRISKIAHKISRLHIKYRVVMALARLLEQRLIDDKSVNRAREILDLYNIGADQSLKYRIVQTRAIFDTILNKNSIDI